MIRASAPAKAILFGEHAVVYGQPSIAFPIHSLRIEVAVESSRDGRTRFIAVDTDGSLDVDEDAAHPLVYAWRLAQEAFAQELPAANFTIRSQIPIAAGFGSGAALSTALIRACQRLAGFELPTEELNKLVYRAEQRYHGNPSGIDNHVVVYERPIYFRQGETPKLLRLGKKLPLIGLRCGDGAPTRTVVEDVRTRREANPNGIDELLESIGALTMAGRVALLAGDLARVGELMYENHRLLRDLGVSSPMQDRAVELSRACGALGAKMSGAGWGGQVLVMTVAGDRDRLSDQFRAAGYPPVFSEAIA